MKYGSSFVYQAWSYGMLKFSRPEFCSCQVSERSCRVQFSGPVGEAISGLSPGKQWYIELAPECMGLA